MTDRARVGVGLVGAGFAARLHVDGYRHVRGIDVVLRGVAAARPERARAFAAECGVETAAKDLDALLGDPAVTVVDLCVPPYLHAPMAVRAARAGKHVIVEKPLTGYFGPAATPRAEMLARALAAADEVLGACREAGVRLCYAENRRSTSRRRRGGAGTDGRSGRPACSPRWRCWPRRRPAGRWRRDSCARSRAPTSRTGAACCSPSTTGPWRRSPARTSCWAASAISSGGALARDVTAVIYGAYLSAAEGRRVDLTPYLDA